MKDILNFYGVALQAGLSAVSFHGSAPLRHKKDAASIPNADTKFPENQIHKKSRN